MKRFYLCFDRTIARNCVHNVSDTAPSVVYWVRFGLLVLMTLITTVLLNFFTVIESEYGVNDTMTENSMVNYSKMLKNMCKKLQKFEFLKFC
jgi:hypothetical protein